MLIILGYALAVVIGVSLGLLGGGGSILTVPVLVYVLGIPVKTAIPMSLVVVGATSAFGVLGHARGGTVHWRTALAFGPPAIVGALLGAQLGLQVPAGVQLAIFAVFMILASISMWFGQRLWAPKATVAESEAPRSLRVVGWLGGLVGVLTGLVGIGGGFLYVPTLVILARLGMKQAVGTSLVLITLSAVSGFARYAGEVSLDWGAVVLFTALAFVGVLAGTRMVRHVSQESLRRGFAVFLLVMGAIVLLRGQ
ncbi:MAG: sulfite exporter TauE/SafE family protein [Gemmatimonadota bacterium]|nr:sulfite exporter TauE/SafE family protein [Gemmatimonadota bacterium]